MCPLLSTVHVQFLRVPVIFSVVIKYFTEAFLLMIDRPFREHTLEPMSLTEFDQHQHHQHLDQHGISCGLCPADPVLAARVLLRQFMR